MPLISGIGIRAKHFHLLGNKSLTREELIISKDLFLTTSRHLFESLMLLYYLKHFLYCEYCICYRRIFFYFCIVLLCYLIPRSAAVYMKRLNFKAMPISSDAFTPVKYISRGNFSTAPGKFFLLFLYKSF